MKLVISTLLGLSISTFVLAQETPTLPQPIYLQIDASTEALRFVKSVMSDLITVVTDTAKDEQPMALCEIVNEAIDMMYVSSQVIRPGFDRLKDMKGEAKDLQTEFVELFSSVTAEFFLSKFESYLKKAKVTYDNNVVVSGDPSDSVFSIILYVDSKDSSSQETKKITFEVSNKNGLYRIRSVELLGSSYARLKYSEYSSLRRNVPLLNQKLRALLERIEFPLCSASE